MKWIFPERKKMDFDAIFQNSLDTHKDTSFTIELNQRNYIRKKRKKDPVKIIHNLPLVTKVKDEAIAYFNTFIEPLEIVEKNVPACVFWSLYAASRRAKIPVALDLIARISGLGMQKYTPDIQSNPLDYGVKVEHKQITDTITYFTTLFHGTKADFDTTPAGVDEFLAQYMEEQELTKEDEAYVFRFLEFLLKDEFWTDQNPSILAYAILIYLSGFEDCPFYKQRIVFPVYVSNNIVMDLINKLKMGVVSVDDEEEEEL